MRRLNLLGALLVALLALGALASSALALPEISLPSGKWTGKNDAPEPTLETLKGEKILCSGATATGEDTSNTLGTLTIKYTGCKEQPLNVSCNGLGEASGTITLTGTYHYVWDTLSPLGVAILFLFNEVHLECTALALLKIKSQSANGGLLCLVLEPSVSMVTHLFHCEQEKGDQKERTYWNDSGTAITNAELLISKNEGAFESCALLGLYSLTYEEAVKINNA